MQTKLSPRQLLDKKKEEEEKKKKEKESIFDSALSISGQSIIF
jgi:hypothetical protein